MKHTAAVAVLLMSASFVLGQGRKVEYQVDGKTYEGHYAAAAPGAPLVLLVHDWDGLTDYEVKRSGMLVALGYAVFAVDMFGKGVRPVELVDKQRLTGELYGNRAAMRARLVAALAEARAQGANTGNAVAMGYCFGGTCVLELAMAGEDLKGFVAFHGGLEIPEGRDYSAAKGSLLILHGSADTYVTLDHFSALAKELETHGVAHEMITYGGAPHAFSVFGSERYREDADRKSWERFTRFLEETTR